MRFLAATLRFLAKKLALIHADLEFSNITSYIKAYANCNLPG